MGETAPSLDAAQALCQACGMCCDGTLFSSVTLEAGDSRSALAEAGVPIVQDPERMWFAQPCAGMVGGHCTLYKDRPMHCRHFRCRLLQEQDAGQVSPAEALDTVGRALAWRALVLSQLDRLGVGGGGDLLSRFRQAQAVPEAAASPLYLYFAGLQNVLIKSFRTTNLVPGTSLVPAPASRPAGVDRGAEPR